MRKRGDVLYERDEIVETAVKAVQWKIAKSKAKEAKAKGRLVLSAENISVRQRNEQGDEHARWTRSLGEEREQPDSPPTAKSERDNNNNSSPKEDPESVNLGNKSLKPPIQGTLKYTKTFKNMKFFPQDDRSLNSFYEPEKAVTSSLREAKEEEDEVETSPDSPISKGSQKTVEIEVYAKWSENSEFLQKMTLQWKERLQLTRIVDILNIVEFLLEKPEHLLLFSEPLTKVQIQLTGNTNTRYINFFWILTELSTITCESEFKTQTKAWFEMEITGEDITHFPLNRILVTEELRYFPKELSDLITKFFMTLVVNNQLNSELLTKRFDDILQENGRKSVNFREIEGVSLEVVKASFLVQVKEDLLAMKKAAEIPVNVFLFEQIKYLTFNRPRSEFMSCYAREQSSTSPGYFTDFLRMLRAMEFPELESIMIYDFIDSSRKINLMQLILLIEKNNKNLKKIVLGGCFSEDDISLLKNKLKSYPNIVVFVLQKTAPEFELETGFARKKSLKFFNKYQSVDPSETLSNFNNTNFWQ